MTILAELVPSVLDITHLLDFLTEYSDVLPAEDLPAVVDVLEKFSRLFDEHMRDMDFQTRTTQSKKELTNKRAKSVGLAVKLEERVQWDIELGSVAFRLRKLLSSFIPIHYPGSVNRSRLKCSFSSADLQSKDDWDVVSGFGSSEREDASILPNGVGSNNRHMSRVSHSAEEGAITGSEYKEYLAYHKAGQLLQDPHKVLTVESERQEYLDALQTVVDYLKQYEPTNCAFDHLDSILQLRQMNILSVSLFREFIDTPVAREEFLIRLDLALLSLRTPLRKGEPSPMESYPEKVQRQLERIKLIADGIRQTPPDGEATNKSKRVNAKPRPLKKREPQSSTSNIGLRDVFLDKETISLHWKVIEGCTERFTNPRSTDSIHYSDSDPLPVQSSKKRKSDSSQSESNMKKRRARMFRFCEKQKKALRHKLSSSQDYRLQCSVDQPPILTRERSYWGLENVTEIDDSASIVRKVCQKFEDYSEKITLDADPDNAVEEEYKILADPIRQFRCQRLVNYVHNSVYEVVASQCRNTDAVREAPLENIVQYCKNPLLANHPPPPIQNSEEAPEAVASAPDDQPQEPIEMTGVESDCIEFVGIQTLDQSDTAASTPDLVNPI